MTPRPPAHLTALGTPPNALVVARSVPARSGEVAGLRRAATDVGREAGLAEERLAEVALAVGEACANAVVHAYTDREPGVLRLTAQVTGAGLEIVVSDDGRGMTPRTDSPGLGLGLPLMASLTTAIELNAPAEGGTAIWMLFASAPRVDESPSWASTG